MLAIGSWSQLTIGWLRYDQQKGLELKTNTIINLKPLFHWHLIWGLQGPHASNLTWQLALLELTTISMPELWQLLCGDLHSLLQSLQILYFLSSHSKGKKFNKGKDHCAWISRRWSSKSNNICFLPGCFRQSSQQSWCERMSSASVKARYPNA